MKREGGWRRFVFIQFLKAKEPERMVIYLDNIFAEGEIIHVNLPRFQHDSPKVLTSKKIIRGRRGKWLLERYGSRRILGSQINRGFRTRRQ